MSIRSKQQSVSFSDIWGSVVAETVYRCEAAGEPGTFDDIWEITDEVGGTDIVLPMLDAIITTDSDRGLRFRKVDQESYGLSGSGGHSGWVLVRDQPAIVGHWSYTSNLQFIRDWFIQQGLAPDLRLSLNNATHLAAWLNSQGQTKANLGLKELRNPLDSGFSLPTFVRESRELVGLFKHVVSYKKQLKRLGRQFRRKSLREIAAIIGNEHLVWAFGILPLISDIQSIFKMLTGWSAVLRDLYYGKRRTYRYVLDFAVDPALIGLGDQYPLNVETEIGRYKGVGGAWSVKYTYSAYYAAYLRFDLRADDIIHTQIGRFLALLDYWGVQADPGIIYDAIPFSFVVDWFTDLGDRIHDLEHDLVGVNMTVYEGAHHIRGMLSRQWYYDSPQAGTKTLQYGDSFTTFVRRHYLPPHPPNKSALKRLGIDKLLLAASLISTRRP
jgi:hypothetical protein